MELLGLLWPCFRPLLLGGLRPPDPPALDMVFVVLGEVFSQLCQENPRTCRGQSRESKNLPRTKPRTKSVQTPTRKIKSQSFVLLNSFPYRKPPYSKNIGRRYSPPRGASINPPPAPWGRSRACQIDSRCLLHLQILPHPSHNSPSYICKSYVGGSMTPPFSSPGAPRIPPGLSKNRARRTLLEIKI